jgi:hypothetical protein
METLSKTPSISDILKKISDDKALVLFNSIAVSPPDNDRYIPLRENESKHKAILFKNFWSNRCWLDKKTQRKILAYYVRKSSL